jgi:hypothetical protein
LLHLLRITKEGIHAVKYEAQKNQLVRQGQLWTDWTDWVDKQERDERDGYLCLVTVAQPTAQHLDELTPLPM